MQASTLLKIHNFQNVIVGLTGNALDEDVAAFLRAGADIVLAKPMRKHHLDALLTYFTENGFQCGVDSYLSLVEVDKSTARIERRERAGLQ